MKRMIFVVLMGLLLLSGCSDKQGADSTDELLLYCGAGIRPPVEEICSEFTKVSGIDIVVDYSGSEVLLSKIKLVQSGDLYLPGDKHYIEQAAENGFIVSRQPVFFFVPTILVKKGNPLGIKGLPDLLKDGVRLGLGDSNACVIGRKTKKVFEKNGIDFAEVEKNLKFKSQTVNELGMQIQAGSLDAVIVWDAIANYYSKHGEAIEIPVGQNVISTVEIGVLKFSENQMASQEFMSFIKSDQATEIFKKHNCRTESP